MSYTKATSAGELLPGAMKKVTINGGDILLVNLEGRFYALSNTCTHMGGSLADGRLEGDVVRCPRHHAGFEVKTGRCVISPKILLLHGHAADLQTYPVRVEQDAVLVDADPVPPPAAQADGVKATRP